VIATVIANREHRIVVWIESSILLLLTAFLCLHTLPRAWGKLNTDFPNYYLSARLAHEGFDTARAYEWIWFEREKDHRALDIPAIGLVPITPFSTLVMWPLTGLSPLAAKQIWILANLALLLPLGWLLHSITGLSYLRIALIFALCFPVHRNLLYGQFYIVLLLLIVAACWAFQRGVTALAGALVAIAAACKIFPVLLVIFFLRRRSWRALIAGAITGSLALAASVAVFGWNLHRTYLLQVLPWSLHGEGLPPYETASASISSVLHYLFLAEPQWNPHPWHNSPLCYAVLEPALQMLVFAPAVLLIRRNDHSPRRVALEWSAFITASLAISTSPASYNFVLLVLPLCVLAALLLERKSYGWLAILLMVYCGICFPFSGQSKVTGPAILLYVPRLPLTLALLVGIYLLLWRDYPGDSSQSNWPNYAWSIAMAAIAIVGVRSTLHLQRAVRREYAYRVPLQTQTYLDANPTCAGGALRYIGFTLNGYRLFSAEQDSHPVDPGPHDDLSFTATPGEIWVEKGRSPHSQVVDFQEPTRVLVDAARDPILSADGQSLAFIRDDHGRGRLMARPVRPSATAHETVLTPAPLNVYEVSFRSEHEYAFSAVEDGRSPHIYLTDRTHANAPLPLGESRYPALSPDGVWMAYSHLEHGVWNLWVRDQQSGDIRRIAEMPCNQIQPSWEDDSRALLYGTDCGRSLWLTAISRRRVIP
jgi:glycosyl transferase family 87/WD40 repeat protein